MRGSQTLQALRYQLRGIIPAHAGLTAEKHPSPIVLEDHPRACGAHFVIQMKLPSVRGSSPRMRGSHSLHHIFLFLGGIIPAHAGLTSCRSARCGRSRDHPRACGAHRYSKDCGGKRQGSSPRMRGSQERNQNTCNLYGIIPAHAGLTPDYCPTESPDWDHPRACGAHNEDSTERARELGSSPRMRGSQSLSLKRAANPGIIPAHAGLTTCRRHSRRRTWDHPRACGAHFVS